ncbi:MAG: sugar phosphate isomerase/epimerase [Alphaproteobacteria bacterium]|nr:sugar phosphate isomerase/epimerase [Alphaproteobacteria bacterium]
MFKALNAPAIGIKNLALPQLLSLAQATGFAGVDFDIREAHRFAEAHSSAALRELFASHNQRPGTWGLPVNGPQMEWNVDLAELHQLAKTAASLGAYRCVTWVPSWHDSRSMAENRAYHIAQFRPVAQVLKDSGCSLGLEFLGPLSLQKGHAHPFIRRMEDMLALAAEIGTGNVGLLLDGWHLWTSGGTLEDLAKIAATDIVHVHINDAPEGNKDELIDVVRCLPLETGRIDLAGFMRTLAKLGYDGPVVTEPFSARLNALAAQNPEAAAKEVAGAMGKLWKMSGLA